MINEMSCDACILSIILCRKMNEYSETLKVSRIQVGMCAQRIFKSVCASTQSGQSLLCPSEQLLGPRIPIKCIANTNQTAHMRRMIRVFSDCT